MRTQAGHAGSVKEPEVPEMRGERGARGAVVQGGRSHAVLAAAATTTTLVWGGYTGATTRGGYRRYRVLTK